MAAAHGGVRDAARRGRPRRVEPTARCRHPRVLPHRPHRRTRARALLRVSLHPRAGAHEDARCRGRVAAERVRAAVRGARLPRAHPRRTDARAEHARSVRVGIRRAERRAILRGARRILSRRTRHFRASRRYKHSCAT